MTQRELPDILSGLRQEVEDLVTHRVAGARRGISESLNQAMRRLKQVRSAEEVARWLIDSTVPFCGRAAFFEVAGPRIVCVLVRGEQAPPLLEALLKEAPAFAHCAADCDTVISIGSAAEISSVVLENLKQDEAGKVYLFPVLMEGKAVGILFAAPDGEPVDVAGLELLCQAASWSVEALGGAEEAAATASLAVASSLVTAASPLVTIKGIDMRPSRRAENVAKKHPLPLLAGMASGERDAHLNARRFSRLAVARLLLDRRDSISWGRAGGDLYSPLQTEIDAARQTFQEDFVATSSSMTDYFHKELVHSLAHDDAALLGTNYPGPLV